MRLKIEINEYQIGLHLEDKLFYAVCDGVKIWILPADGHALAPKVQHKALTKSFMFINAIKKPHDRRDKPLLDCLVET